ncbi:PaaI family thioesterase [Aquabacterium sp.]|uniref:PaaI family thioesterase n=1 Tax=Aquabacterium sp. TaxID=1872578 RepID=UPI002BCC9DFE|nr:PaaI family thioesterase [Aquabacterium sp.]HSW04749.1 PaaI family thioesterase [Aquabacterium sp.]
MTPEEQQRFLDLGREVLAKQPFSVLLGAQLLALKPGYCELMVPMSEEIQQQHGFAHGGVISYLADNALTYAGGTAMRVPVVTSEFKINYLRPAIGERFIARAAAAHVARTQTVARCEVFAVKDGNEKLIAIAQGTIAKLGEAPPVPADAT